MTSTSLSASAASIGAPPHGVELTGTQWRCLPVLRDLTVPYVLSLLIAAALLVVSVAGLLFGERALYEPDPLTLPAFLGQDGVTLVAGVPLLLGSVWAARRGSVRGLLLWAGRGAARAGRSGCQRTG